MATDCYSLDGVNLPPMVWDCARRASRRQRDPVRRGATSPHRHRYGGGSGERVCVLGARGRRRRRTRPSPGRQGLGAAIQAAEAHGTQVHHRGRPPTTRSWGSSLVALTTGRPPATSTRPHSQTGGAWRRPLNRGAPQTTWPLTMPSWTRIQVGTGPAAGASFGVNVRQLRGPYCG